MTENAAAAAAEANLKRFPPHWLPEQVEHNKDRLILGLIRINPKNYQDAFVSFSPTEAEAAPEADIHIQGMRDRNRALQVTYLLI